jgi:hypothetical protein
MKYGYSRVSTDGQSVDAQVRQLTKAGCKNVVCFEVVATAEAGIRLRTASPGRQCPDAVHHLAADREVQFQVEPHPTACYRMAG